MLGSTITATLAWWNGVTPMQRACGIMAILFFFASGAARHRASCQCLSVKPKRRRRQRCKSKRRPAAYQGRSGTTHKRRGNHRDQSGGADGSFLLVRHSWQPSYMSKPEVNRRLLDGDGVHTAIPSRNRAQWLFVLLILMVAALVAIAHCTHSSTLEPIVEGNITLHDPYVAVKIGEARKPGPGSSEEAPNDFFDVSEDELTDVPEDGSDVEADYSCVGPGLDPGIESGGSDDDSSSTCSGVESAQNERIHEVVIPPWDSKLSDDQIAAWRTAESRLGTIRSTKGWLAATRKREATRTTAQPPSPPALHVNFLLATTYAGPLEGFYFGSCEGQLGYHRDCKVKTRTQICLADELLSQPGAVLCNPPTKPTRRKKNVNGARLRNHSRRWVSLRSSAAHSAIMQDPGASEIGWRQPKGAGLWSIDTANANAWSTGKRQILGRSSADIVLMQETKLRASRIATAKGQAGRLGWRTHFGPALVTSALGTSGGTSVSSRKGLGSSPHELIKEDCCHRIGGAWVGAIVKGGVHNSRCT